MEPIMPTQPPRRIIVSGDSMPGMYRLPAHTLSRKDCENFGKIQTDRNWSSLDPDREHEFHLDGGATVLYQCIRGIQENDGITTFNPATLPGPFFPPHQADSTNCLVRVENDSKKVLIRVAEEGNVPLGSFNRLKATTVSTIGPRTTPGASDIVAHWLMPLRDIQRLCDRKDPALMGCVVPAKGPECLFHVQVGLLSGDNKRQHGAHEGVQVGPNSLALPNQARVIVASLDDICPLVRVRRALSYDSIAVDLLSVARGYEQTPAPTPQLESMLGIKNEPDPLLPVTFMVIRINNASALIYKLWPKRPEGTAPDQQMAWQEAAWLLFHEDRSAPLIDPGKGRMFGYNTLIGASIAEKLSSSQIDADLDGTLLDAVDRSIQMQFSHFNSGFVSILGDSLEYGSIPGDAIKQATEMATRSALAPSESPVRRVRIDIADAVARHSLWFVTKNWKQPGLPIAWNPEERFRQIAGEWLCLEGKEPKETIPTVSIKKQMLVDRREIEDYLSLRGEMIRYAQSSKAGTAKRPLNLAVFGPPGSGKSFGIKQVTEDILDFGGYDSTPFEFNLSQFTSLDDYAVAFHQVRDSCLKSKIPIVFFDEFDSGFEGIPFGWLKYFLAPMQDGEFTDRGRKYRLGNCVMVFAGGVNRSFEEFAGRSRSQAFIEAKGPDFMSRLRDHINIRGINKPDVDDQFDQGRYLLRRGSILHGMLCERLRRRRDESEGPLLKPEVARAFLGIDGFRHGIRSMEAILDMSDLRRSSTLGPSDLPPLEQLNMHVDGREFLDLVRKPANGPGRDDVQQIAAFLALPDSGPYGSVTAEDKKMAAWLNKIRGSANQARTPIERLYLEHSPLFPRLLRLAKESNA
jgi:hypothetical protein